MTRPHPGRPFFAELGDYLGSAYLRYNFTKGTAGEVRFLQEVMDLDPPARILDVGCGPGRHALVLAGAGYQVTGVDISERFLNLARDQANELGIPGDKLALFHVDAREMPFDEEFAAVISICEGAFGLMGTDDGLILRRMMEATKPGGLVIVTAINAYCEVRTERPDRYLDADAGIVHEMTTVKDPEGREREVDLWTTVYTPRELRLLAMGVGLVPEHVWAVEPGDFARRPPDVEHAELMLVARKPGS